MRPVNAELISILVSQPVEANGILSRIEQHAVHIRDGLQAQAEADVFNSASEAKIALERHEALASMFVELRANHSRVCAKLDAIQEALDRQDRSLGRIHDALDDAAVKAENRHAVITRRLPDDAP